MDSAFRSVEGDPIDNWLRGEGFVRKHSPIDESSLFKAISEQLFSTQFHHPKVRDECVDFMRKNRDSFEKDINQPYDDYLDKMSTITGWPGETEIQAISLLYERDVVIYDGMTMTRNALTNNGFSEYFYLCQSSPTHYESVFPKESISSAAYCQTIDHTEEAGLAVVDVKASGESELMIDEVTGELEPAAVAAAAAEAPGAPQVDQRLQQLIDMGRLFEVDPPRNIRDEVILGDEFQRADEHEVSFDEDEHEVTFDVDKLLQFDKDAKSGSGAA